MINATRHEPRCPFIFFFKFPKTHAKNSTMEWVFHINLWNVHFLFFRLLIELKTAAYTGKQLIKSRCIWSIWRSIQWSLHVNNRNSTLSVPQKRLLMVPANPCFDLLLTSHLYCGLAISTLVLFIKRRTCGM